MERKASRPASVAPKSVPSFRDSKGIHYADTCEPLRKAVAEERIEMHALARENYPGLPFPGNALSEVRTVGFWDASRVQNWGLDWHRNEGIEITFLARGRLAFSVDGTEHALQRGHLTITRPWQSHRVGLPHVDPSRLHWLILDVGVRRPNQRWQWPDWVVLAPADLGRLTRLLQHNEHPVWVANETIEAAFEALASAVKDPSQVTLESELRLRINDLLVAILRLLMSQPVALDEQLTSTRRGVEMFLRDLPSDLARGWSLDEMAKACGLGRTQFCRHCQDITNMTPVEYLNHCRMQLAARLLASPPETSVTEIAMACGFSSSQYFAAQFRKYHLNTPTAFRASRWRAEHKQEDPEGRRLG